MNKLHRQQAQRDQQQRLAGSSGGLLGDASGDTGLSMATAQGLSSVEIPLFLPLGAAAGLLALDLAATAPVHRGPTLMLPEAPALPLSCSQPPTVQDQLLKPRRSFGIIAAGGCVRPPLGSSSSSSSMGPAVSQNGMPSSIAISAVGMGGGGSGAGSYQPDHTQMHFQAGKEPPSARGQGALSAADGHGIPLDPNSEHLDALARMAASTLLEQEQRWHQQQHHHQQQQQQGAAGLDGALYTSKFSSRSSADGALVDSRPSPTHTALSRAELPLDTSPIHQSLEAPSAMMNPPVCRRARRRWGPEGCKALSCRGLSFGDSS